MEIDASNLSLSLPAWAGGLYSILLIAGIAANVRIRRIHHRNPKVWRRQVTRLGHTQWTWHDLSLIVLTTGCIIFALNSLNSVLALHFTSRVLIMHIGVITVGLILWRDKNTRQKDGQPTNNLIAPEPRHLPPRSRKRSTVYGTGVLFYLASLPFVLIAGIINRILLNLCGVSPTLQETAMELITTSDRRARTLLVIAAALTAPVFEELIFREMVLPLTARITGVIPAVIITSAVFALIHLHTATFLPLFTLAIFLSIAYIYTRSLRTVIVMHALFNIVNVALLLSIFNTINPTP